MGSNVDPLVVGGVIGEVVDLFVPTTMMDVNFGTKHVNNGCDIKPSLAANPPFIQIGGHPCHLFTLVMTDPDAPSPSEPSMRECLHWLVINIPGGTGPIQGDEVISYVGPKPPLGIHRYTLVLFQQKSRLSTASIELPPRTRETGPNSTHAILQISTTSECRWQPSTSIPTKNPTGADIDPW